MQVALTTCDRQPRYVLETLSSMESQDPDGWPYIEPLLRVVVDGEDASFLGDYARYAECHASPPERRRRIFTNTTMALTGADPRRPLILCQDDVAFAQGWLHRARELAVAAEERHGSGFCIALWHGYPWAHPDGLQPYMPRKFYGNVCLYLSQPIVGELAAYMAALEPDPPTTDDLAVRVFFHKRPWYQLLAATPSLAQHIGDISTDEGCSEIRRSPTFGESCDPNSTVTAG